MDHRSVQRPIDFQMRFFTSSFQIRPRSRQPLQPSSIKYSKAWFVMTQYTSLNHPLFEEKKCLGCDFWKYLPFVFFFNGKYFMFQTRFLEKSLMNRINCNFYFYHCYFPTTTTTPATETTAPTSVGAIITTYYKYQTELLHRNQLLLLLILQQLP